MHTPKKCALCACIEEKGHPTCRFCGEATWLGVYVDGTAETPQLTMIPPEPSEPDLPAAASKPKKRSK
jgi:hypothetical protein